MEYANYSEEDLRSPAYSNEPRKPAPWRRRIIPLGFTKARQWNCRACQASVSFLQCKTSYLIFFFLFFVTFWLGVKKPYPWTIVLFSSGTGSLVVVKCEKRRQSYCLLCSVRLRKGDHMTSNSHRYKYLVCVCVCVLDQSPDSGRAEVEHVFWCSVNRSSILLPGIWTRRGCWQRSLTWLI